MHQKRPHKNQKHLIAAEAARILSEQSDLSLSQAKHKAAEHLGLGKKVALPDNAEVEIALRSYQELFLGQSQPDELHRLRSLALNAMQTFADFHPRLVGDISSGTAYRHSAVKLLLFCETTEEVVFCLIDKKIPWIEREVACHYSGNMTHRRPLITFSAGDTSIELLLLPNKDKLNPPTSAPGSPPEKGLSRSEVQELLA